MRSRIAMRALRNCLVECLPGSSSIACTRRLFLLCQFYIHVSLSVRFFGEFVHWFNIEFVHLLHFVKSGHICFNLLFLCNLKCVL